MINYLMKIKFSFQLNGLFNEIERVARAQVAKAYAKKRFNKKRNQLNARHSISSLNYRLN